ncbi:MAG: hypothetical protein Q8T09_19925 [Candidatus Melainabacteria bacterium]|nr:hypothetical protein [Candidatus Melainabacteria bacterium]
MSLAAIYSTLFGRYQPGTIASKKAWNKVLIVGSFLSSALLLLVSCLTFTVTVTGCTPELGDATLTQNTRIELVDWHISGLWVINCPVCWIRVANYNNVPIKDITIKYQTFDFDSKPLDQGSYTIDGEVGPGQVKNFIEQYVGIVQVESDKLKIELSTVHLGEGH